MQICVCLHPCINTVDFGHDDLLHCPSLPPAQCCNLHKKNKDKRLSVVVLMGLLSSNPSIHVGWKPGQSAALRTCHRCVTDSGASLHGLEWLHTAGLPAGFVWPVKAFTLCPEPDHKASWCLPQLPLHAACWLIVTQTTNTFNIHTSVWPKWALEVDAAPLISSAAVAEAVGASSATRMILYVLEDTAKTF